MTKIDIPYFRPAVTDAEIDEVVSALRSGWLTSGPKVKQFEREFALAAGASHAMAVNSCTAALHFFSRSSGRAVAAISSSKRAFSLRMSIFE